MTHPLTPFVFHRHPAPYPTDYGVVTAARSRTGIGVARHGSIAHRIARLATLFVDNRARFGAQWLCGSGTLDAILLADASQHGGICSRCEEAAHPVVYRCFDAARHLLYIGSTRRWSARRTLHITESPWWGEVAEVVCETFNSITEARLAERLAIQAEHPKYNVRHRAPREAVSA